MDIIKIENVIQKAIDPKVKPRITHGLSLFELIFIDGWTNVI